MVSRKKTTPKKTTTQKKSESSTKGWITRHLNVSQEKSSGTKKPIRFAR